MKVNMALYQYSHGGSPTGMTEGLASYTPATRISEFVEVDFPDRSREEMIPEQIAKLDKEIAEEKERFSRVIERLNQRKSEILAITDEREVA